MKYLYLFSILFLLTFNHTVAQICTEEQQEVWNVVEEYWKLWKLNDIDSAFSTISDNYLGWNITQPMPMSKEEWMSQEKTYLDFISNKSYDIDLAKIHVQGNAAVVHYYYSFSYDWKYEGDEGNVKLKGKWTEFFVKEKKKWMLIGDMTTWDE
jgi:hypothetical protein